MPTREPYPPALDPSHISAICAGAAPAGGRHRTLLLAGGREGIHVFLPTRADAQSAQAALGRVGYRVVRAADHSRARHLVIRGWSSEALEVRLIAMRSVLEQLAADPGSTATTTLDQLSHLPVAALPDGAGQQQLSRQAGEQLLRWIFATSGIHAPHDPLTHPADAGRALQLSTAWRLEEAIEDLAARHIRVAAGALALYTALRQQMAHDSARDTAVRRASVVFHLSSKVAQDTTQILRNVGKAPGAGMPGHNAAAKELLRPAQPGIRPGPERARVYPFTGALASPAPERPRRPASGSHGRNFPSGRAGRHP